MDVIDTLPTARYQGSMAVQKTISLLDYGAGNLRSVARALEHVGALVKVVKSAQEIQHSERLLVPGQGAFDQCMAKLEADGLDDAIREHVQRARPYLGICLGLQLLFDKSHEHGEHAGLGILQGEVVPIPPKTGLKIPHMGWNQVTWDSPMGPLSSPTNSEWFYFVHSYQVKPAQTIDCAYTHHGEAVVAAVIHDNIFACQFHPEKSQQAGLNVLEGFLS